MLTEVLTSIRFNDRSFEDLPQGRFLYSTNMAMKHLTCRLLVEGETHQTVLKNLDGLNIYQLKEGLNFRGVVAIPNQFANTPPWFDVVRSCVDEEMQCVENKSSKAALFIEVGDRVVVFTFGQGRHLLNPDLVVADFGLKVALNSIDPDKMRSIDAKTIDERTMNTRRQSSKTSSLETFGLNISRDLVKAVNGVPRNKDFAKNITGAEALAFSAEFEIENLGDKCVELLEMYGRETYKERFGWIDNLKPVKNKTIIASLDNILITSLKNSDFENTYLAPPEIFDWQDVHGFCFSNNANDERKPDLKIEDFLSNYRDLNELSLELLKNRDRAIMIYGDEYEKEWSIYKCLVYETIGADGLLYVLTEGKWYSVANSFVEDVNAGIMSINVSNLDFPLAISGEREDAYNARVAESRADCLLFDKKNISPGRGQSPIEFCDLFTADKQFIHVKKRANSSSTLSHLFAQGRVSAITFLDHQEFRRKVKEKIVVMNAEMVSLVPDEKPNTSEFEVVYAIISSIAEQDWQKKLPFFSRLNLVETSKDLQRLGYEVSLLRIQKERQETEETVHRV